MGVLGAIPIAVDSPPCVIRHALPVPLPSTSMEVADQIAEHAKDEGRHERVLLDGAADSATAFADVAARLRVTVQSLAHVDRAGLIGILGKLRRPLGHVAHRFCGLTRNALRCAFAWVGAGSCVSWHGGLHWG